MSTIPADRQIHTKLSIGRTDGSTWSDLTDCLARARIELGDVTGLGAEGSGGDMPVRRMTMTLRNDGAPLSPHIQGSSWNQFNGSYSPLLWPMREVLLDVAATVPGTAPQSGDWVRLFHGYLGDSIQVDGDSVTCDCRDLAKRLQNAYIETVREYGSKAGVAAETVIQSILNDNLGLGWATLYTPTSPGFALHPYRVEYQSVWDAIQQIAAQIGWWLGYRWDAGSNQFRLTFMAPPRMGNLAPYSDYSNRVYGQKYTAESFGGDAADVYYYASGGYGGIPYKKLVKTTAGSGGSYLDDHSPISIKDNTTYIISAWMKASRNVYVSAYVLCINRISDNAYRTGPSGLDLTTQWQRFSWVYHAEAGHAGDYQARHIIYADENLPLEVCWCGFQVEKQTAATWSLTAADDIYAQPLDISDADIRNVVAVTYKDRTLGKRRTVTVSDAVSILEYGRRAMGIEEQNASLIDTAAEAQALAQAAVDDLRDMTGTTRIVMPLMPRLELFHGVTVQNPLVSDQTDFYGVDSVMHDLDFEAGRFRTEVIASRRVVGARTRWLQMQTRPGGTVPITGGDVIGGQATATLVVAASDSSWRGRQSADYICDGVSDQVQINDALDWLVSDGRTGGKVMLLEGTYVIDGHILMPSDTQIEGQGAGTVIKIKDGYTLPPAPNRYLYMIANRDASNTRLRVAHLTLDGNKAKTAETSLIWAIAFHTVTDSVIEGVQSVNAPANEIEVYGDRNRVSECRLQNARAGGLVVAYGSGCTVSGNVVHAAGSHGIMLSNLANSVVTGNVSKGNEFGISVYECVSCTITDNAISESGYDGIYMYKCKECQVTGNNIMASGQINNPDWGNSGIRLFWESSRNNVQHNTIRRGDGSMKPAYGIWIKSADCDRNLVTNNDLYLSGTTASLKNDGSNTVTTAGNRT